ILLLIFQTALSCFVLAQVNDSSVKNVDSAVHERPDSVRKKRHLTRFDSSAEIKADTLGNVSAAAQMDTNWMLIARQHPGRSFTRHAYQQNHLFGFSSKALLIKSDRKE